MACLCLEFVVVIAFGCVGVASYITKGFVVSFLWRTMIQSVNERSYGGKEKSKCFGSKLNKGGILLSHVDPNKSFYFMFCKVFQVVIFLALIIALSPWLVMLGHDVAMKRVL